MSLHNFFFFFLKEICSTAYEPEFQYCKRYFSQRILNATVYILHFTSFNIGCCIILTLYRSRRMYSMTWFEVFSLIQNLLERFRRLPLPPPRNSQSTGRCDVVSDFLFWCGIKLVFFFQVKKSDFFLFI